MATETADSHALYLVKGMLTKFMRMLFPLEFRIDSLANTGAVLPFHFPLMPGEMIYLPDMVSGIGGASMARDYYVLTAAPSRWASRVRHLRFPAGRFVGL